MGEKEFGFEFSKMSLAELQYAVNASEKLFMKNHNNRNLEAQIQSTRQYMDYISQLEAVRELLSNADDLDEIRKKVLELKQFEQIYLSYKAEVIDINAKKESELE